MLSEYLVRVLINYLTEGIPPSPSDTDYFHGKLEFEQLPTMFKLFLEGGSSRLFPSESAKIAFGN